MSKLSDRLTSLRDKAGATNEELASAAGIAVDTVTGILSGDILRPPENRLRGFARVLGVSLDSLMTLVPGDSARAPDLGRSTHKGASIKILSETADNITIGGYAVIFDTTDLDGETFTKDTDFMLDLVPQKPLLYDHGGNSKFGGEFIGTVTKMAPDSRGQWLEAEIAKSEKYKDIVKLIEAERVGLSTGSVGHMTQRKGSVIKTWPIVEVSLTTTPAEHRTIGVTRIKELSNYAEALKALLPEVAQDSDGSEATDAATSIIKSTQETQPMSEEKLTALMELVQTNAESIKALSERKPEPKELPASNAKAAGFVSAPTVTGDEADRALKGNPFKSTGEFLQSVVRAYDNQSRDKRLHPLKSFLPGEGGATYNLPSSVKAPTGLGELIAPNGGFAVGTDNNMSIMSSAYEGGQVTSRVDTLPISGNSNGMTMRYATDTSRTTGNRGGGIQAYWMAEAAALTASAPTIRETTLKLHKLGALVYLTDELIQDAPAMEAFVNREYPIELQWMIQNAYVRGTGTGQPLGVIDAPGTAVAAAEGGQAAGTITAVNIMQMWSQMIASSRPNAVWFVNQAIEPQLSQLSYSVGTGGQLVWMPAGGLSASPYQTLNGRPVIAIEQCSALGTVGDIILGDWNQYVAITKGGVRSESSIHVRFLNDEVALRFIVRVDGQPKQDSTITPANGTTALGRFVTLATRS